MITNSTRLAALLFMSASLIASQHGAPQRATSSTSALQSQSVGAGQAGAITVRSHEELDQFIRENLNDADFFVTGFGSMLPAPISMPLLALLDNESAMLHSLYEHSRQTPAGQVQFNRFATTLARAFQDFEQEAQQYRGQADWRDRTQHTWRVPQSMNAVINALKELPYARELMQNQVQARFANIASTALGITRPQATQLQRAVLAGDYATRIATQAQAMGVQIEPQQVTEALNQVRQGHAHEVINQYQAELATIAPQVGINLTQPELASIAAGGLHDAQNQPTELAQRLAANLGQLGIPQVSPEQIAAIDAQGLTPQQVRALAAQAVLATPMGGNLAIMPGLPNMMTGNRQATGPFPLRETGLLHRWTKKDLFVAAYEGQMDKLTAFTQRYPQLINEMDDAQSDGDAIPFTGSALVYAAFGYRAGNVEAERAFIHLLKAGADYNVDFGQDILSEALKKKESDPKIDARRARLLTILNEHIANPAGVITPVSLDVATNGFSWKKWLIIGGGLAVTGAIAYKMWQNKKARQATPAVPAVQPH